MPAPRRLVIGISGASGAVYVERVFYHLRYWPGELIVTASKTGMGIIYNERGLKLPENTETINHLLDDWLKLRSGTYRPKVTFHPHHYIGAPIASGSFRTLGMAVIPASMAKVSALAVGQSRDLLERAADVCLKEGRTLVVVPRESPLSAVHLENMLKLARLGVKVVPAMPGFYHNPTSIEEIGDFVAARTLDALGLNLPILEEWTGHQQ
ncbi:MAG: UbiX family flavin prenyltransferase [Firmicutes bacterium]|nr:UbiX family flavin prenyltransferase [Bacillota bacterium]